MLQGSPYQESYYLSWGLRPTLVEHQKMLLEMLSMGLSSLPGSLCPANAVLRCKR
jgi:hypothetical protein